MKEYAYQAVSYAQKEILSLATDKETITPAWNGFEQFLFGIGYWDRETHACCIIMRLYWVYTRQRGLALPVSYSIVLQRKSGMLFAEIKWIRHSSKHMTSFL